MRRTVLAITVAIAMSSTAVSSAVGAAGADEAPTPSQSVAPVPTAERTDPSPETTAPSETTAPPAGPRVVKRMISSVPVAKGQGVWFVPTMNPDGAARGTRTNARGVDLDRNWPTSGFTSRGKGTRTWGGPRAQSERETRAMLRFLKAKKPDYVASLH